MVSESARSPSAVPKPVNSARAAPPPPPVMVVAESPRSRVVVTSARAKPSFAPVPTSTGGSGRFGVRPATRAVPPRPRAPSRR
jgi:hypothetical protein